jgi:gluconolactonase
MRAAGILLLLAGLPTVLAGSPPLSRRHCIPGIGPVGGLAKIATGFRFTEGPRYDAAGNLYFTDIEDGWGKIFRLGPCGRLSVFKECSNRTNGLALNHLGEIVACEMAAGRVVAHSADGSTTRVLASCFGGRRFNAPNDLVIDRHGGIYFTDPLFYSPRPVRPQPVQGVYYLAPTGEVRRLIADLWNPNGLALSPDESTLYVVASQEKHVMAYPVIAPGCLGKGWRFCRLAISGIPFYPGGDGATVDCRGNLYVTSHRGVQVYDPSGARLGILDLPEDPSNVTFGGPDGKTLYVTARTSIYAARMLVAGAH